MSDGDARASVEGASRAAAEGAARASYGRLLAFVAARTRDVAAAEDALGDAFRAALEHWPARGVPANPDAWLLTVARRGLANHWRHGAAVAAAEPALRHATTAAAATLPDFPDERLKLLFVCAHPAIDVAARAPLMLQTVLGLDAAAIAAAWLVPPATMGARLGRAKARLRATGVAFEVPDPERLDARLGAVLDAIYAAFTLGWAAGGEATGEGGPALASEALFLARLTAALLPHATEARGLAALLLLSEARRAARRVDGRYVPLAEQDPARWDAALIAEGEAHLHAASGGVGRYGIEAAIQSAHVWRARSGRTPWRAVVGLYDRLLAVAPTPGAGVARAAALGEADGPAAALAALDALGERDFQPWWAVRAAMLVRAGADAGAAFDRAIALTGDAAVRDWLQACRNRAAASPVAGGTSGSATMTEITYHVVEHDGGWTYKLGDVFAETYRTHDEAAAAAKAAAAEQQLGGETVPISWQDADGKWHEEVARGDDRPIADVEG